MLTRAIGRACSLLLGAIVRVFVACHITPNALTVFGFLLNVVAAYLFAYGYFRWAGGTIILAGLFDMLDGKR